MRAYAPSWWILWKAGRKRTVEIYLSFLWASYILATKYWLREYEKMWYTTSCPCWSRTYLSMHASWERGGARDTGGVAVLSTLPWLVTSILCIVKCQPYPGMLQVSYAYLQSFAFQLQSLRTTLVYNSSFSNYSLEVFFVLCGSCLALGKWQWAKPYLAVLYLEWHKSWHEYVV